MPQENFSLVRGKTIRITNLDDCCSPPEEGSECALAVFDAFTIMSISANVEEGETLLTRKANGDVCVNERDPNLLQDLTVTLTLCQVQPEVISMITGWPVTRNSDGVAVGFDVMSGSSDREVALEAWSGVAGLDCGAGARYGYSVLPCTSGWQIDGDLNLAAGVSEEFTVTLTSTAKDTHGWGFGPYAVQLQEDGEPGPLLDPLQTGSLARLMATDVPPPAVTDGCVDATADNGFLFGPGQVVAPTLTGVDPDTGDEAGGETVTLTGTGFTEQPTN